jgi:hypothetical protein
MKEVFYLITINCLDYIASVVGERNMSTVHWWNASKLVHLQASKFLCTPSSI